MSAQNPITNQWVYFVDKCLPFGASISCSHFQRVLNALNHMVKVKTKSSPTNYLDDFLFYALSKLRCNFLMREFLSLCEKIGFPIAMDKTEWATEVITFLGILLDGIHFVLRLPVEKKERAEYLLKLMMDKKKATVKEMQVLCGYLNFLCKAIYPGRVFTRRMYVKYSSIVSMDKNKRLKVYRPKPFHHVRLDREFKLDCAIWTQFLSGNLDQVVNRPMLDLSEKWETTATEIRFYSDASAGLELGFGCILETRWIYGKWGKEFMEKCEPSIEFLELFGLCAGIFTWEEELANQRLIIFCDNQAVIAMVNNMTSGCRHCMHLLRLLTLNGMKYNRRLYVKYVSSKNNFLADSLSRLEFDRFRRLGPEMNQYPEKINESLWPVTKVWRD